MLPPGAGTNGLAAAEVICQAAPGVRPREGAARAGADGPSRVGVCGPINQAALTRHSAAGRSSIKGLSLPICPTRKIIPALSTSLDYCAKNGSEGGGDDDDGDGRGGSDDDSLFAMSTLYLPAVWKCYTQDSNPNSWV